MAELHKAEKADGKTEELMQEINVLSKRIQEVKKAAEKM
jgi:hypothetical protein